MAEQGTLLAILRPGREVTDQVLQGMMPFDLRAELARNLFPLHLWHQSVSCLYPAIMRGRLLEAFSTIRASSFTMQLDRLRSRRHQSGRIHWEVVPSLGTPAGFGHLINARRSAFSELGIHDDISNSAHLTASYSAPAMIEPLRFEPVIWRPSLIELVQVIGQGRDYSYQTIATRQLDSAGERPPVQASMSF